MEAEKKTKKKTLGIFSPASLNRLGLEVWMNKSREKKNLYALPTKAYIHYTSME